MFVLDFWLQRIPQHLQQNNSNQGQCLQCIRMTKFAEEKDNIIAHRNSGNESKQTCSEIITIQVHQIKTKLLNIEFATLQPEQIN
jgi:hypothetical protein